MINFNFIFTNTKLCLIELWSNKIRALLTSFGIFLGIASLLINISFIRGMNEDIKKNMEFIGGLNIITVKKKQPVNNNDIQNFNESTILKLQDVEIVQKRVPNVRSLLPSVRMPWGPVKAGGKKTYAIIQAVGPDHQRVYNIQAGNGRNLLTDDHFQKRNVCIIGKRIARRLFESEKAAIGKQLIMNNNQFTIVGVIQTDDEYERKARMILFPFSLYSYRFGKKSGQLDEIAVELWNSDLIEQNTNDILRIFKEIHRGAENIEIQTNISKITEMRTASMGIRILLFCIAIISLIVGGISIMNIMFASIGDRIREIGIRKALGANQLDIFFQFIIEAIILCIVGGLPGLIGGVVTLFPKGFFPFSPTLFFTDYVIAVGFTVLAGFLSGIVPAFIAAKMQPMEALQY